MSRQFQGLFFAVCCTLLLPVAGFAAPPADQAISTPLLTGTEPDLNQVVIVRPARPLKGVVIAKASSSGRAVETRLTLTGKETEFQVLVPACAADSCPAAIAIDRPRRLRLSLTLPRARRFRVLLSPFSHIDAGFTNCQRKVLAQNFDNLRAVLDLIDRTRDYPEAARFRFFTEVSWPVTSFMDSDTVSAADKARMTAALRDGAVELGAFYISHQDKFMPAEALWRSANPALALADAIGAPLRTGCLNDLADLSGIVRPLAAAGCRYFIGGPNTNHYLVPPLFYLTPREGGPRILCWVPPNFNGYGENVDLNLRVALPVDDAGLDAAAAKLGPYLQALVDAGAPPMQVRAHFDFFGQSWPYPYDVYFLPFYPAHAVDNGPQDITPSELAAAWNKKYAWPRLEVVTPAQFFSEMESRYAAQIPEFRGELPGYWGEQMMFALTQTDPEKEAIQREFERRALAAEARGAEDLLSGRAPAGLDLIPRAYKLIALNNDHNPGPVWFGHTNYSEADGLEWKRTRRGWMAEQQQIMSAFPAPAAVAPAPGAITGADLGDRVVLENEFYRVEIDTATGGVSSLFDKELNRELAGRDGKFLLNQYVAVAPGEVTGLRGTVFARPGFKPKSVTVALAAPEAARVAATVTGTPAANRDQLKGLLRFVKKATGVALPAAVVQPLAERFLGVKLGPVKSVEQEIFLLAGVKAVYFNQRIAGGRQQVIDHAFAYPLALSPSTPILFDGPYSPFRFAPAAPLGPGDLIPAAKMLDTDFPGINDITWQFGWIWGMPADAMLRKWALLRDGDVAVVFSCRESGVLLPGPLTKDPLKGPFGGAFYHVGLGFTAYGKSFLDAHDDGPFEFHSAVTSFAADDEAAARAGAERFGATHVGLAPVAAAFVSSAPAAVVTAAWPAGPDALVFRVWDVGGVGAETEVTLPGTAAVKRAVRARSDGKADGAELPVAGRAVRVKLDPGETVTVRVEL